MKRVNPDTKEARRLIAMYNDTTCTDIMELYKKPSSNKINSFNHLYYSVPIEHRSTIKVWGNSNVFTVGFKGYDGYYIMTYANTYYIPYVK